MKAKTAAEERAIYRRVFGGTDGRYVLSQLARVANIGVAIPPEFTPEALRHAEGMRALFWFIYHRAVLPGRLPPKDHPPQFDFETADGLAPLLGGDLEEDA